MKIQPYFSQKKEENYPLSARNLFNFKKKSSHETKMMNWFRSLESDFCVENSPEVVPPVWEERPIEIVFFQQDQENQKKEIYRQPLTCRVESTVYPEDDVSSSTESDTESDRTRYSYRRQDFKDYRDLRAEVKSTYLHSENKRLVTKYIEILTDSKFKKEVCKFESEKKKDCIDNAKDWTTQFLCFFSIKKFALPIHRLKIEEDTSLFFQDMKKNLDDIHLIMKLLFSVEDDFFDFPDDIFPNSVQFLEDFFLSFTRPLEELSSRGMQNTKEQIENFILDYLIQTDMLSAIFIGSGIQGLLLMKEILSILKRGNHSILHKRICDFIY